MDASDHFLELLVKLVSHSYINYSIKSHPQMENYDTLGERIKTFEEALNRRQEGQQQAQAKRAEVLAELQEDY